MSLNNQNSQEKFFDENNYFKYSNRNKQNYVLKKRDINCKNDDKGIFFPNKENKFSIFMKNVNRNPLSSKILSTSLSQNILSFSTKNVNNNYSSTKLMLPSIVNSNNKDDNSNIIVPQRRRFKLKTEKIPDYKIKLFQQKIQNVGNCDNIQKKPINLDFLKDKTKYYELFFYNEKDYYKRLERGKRRKMEKKLKKKTNSVFNYNEYLYEQNDFLFQKIFQA